MKPVCTWPLDKNGLVPLTEMVEPPGGCELPPGFKGFYIAQVIQDEYGHTLDGDFDTQGSHGCKHTNTKEWKSHHKRREIRMDDIKEQTPTMLADSHPTMRAEVQQPDPLAGMAALMPKNGDASMATVALALVGVAGSGALVKFYRDWQKGRHEENMKRLEIEEKRADKQDDQHKQCAISRAALEAKVADLEAKLQQVEKKSMSLSFGDDFDPEEHEARLKKLEKMVKSLQKKEA